MKQRGFTLIELVIVIVILGILAVTAAPRFLDLTGDARISTLEGMQGAVKSANSQVYAKAAIEGVVEQADATVATGEGDIIAEYGSISTDDTTNETAANLTTVVDTNDWIVAFNGSGAGAGTDVAAGNLAIIPGDMNPDNSWNLTTGGSGCFLLYTPASDTGSANGPTYEIVSDQC